MGRETTESQLAAVVASIQHGTKSQGCLFPPAELTGLAFNRNAVIFYGVVLRFGDMHG